MFLTDSTYLYLMILEEILAEGRNYSDGRLFQQKAKNKDFLGVHFWGVFPFVFAVLLLWGFLLRTQHAFETKIKYGHTKRPNGSYQVSLKNRVKLP